MKETVIDRNFNYCLTGTPLLGTDYNSKALFGGYIHKYYYNFSIAVYLTFNAGRNRNQLQYNVKSSFTRNRNLKSIVVNLKMNSYLIKIDNLKTIA
jgi:hypothetical protein